MTSFKVDDVKSTLERLRLLTYFKGQVVKQGVLGAGWVFVGGWGIGRPFERLRLLICFSLLT